MRQLAGTTALVTGGGSGIGRATALAFAALRAKVMVADRDIESAEATVELVTAAKGSAAAVECDVTKEDQVEAMVAATVDTFDSLDSAFNNAGASMDRYALHETPLDHWNASLSVNLTGTFLCLKHQLRYMIGNGGGSLVNMASGAARVPAPGRSPYSAAKRGVVALTAHVAKDYAPMSIRANAVLPGLIDTPGVRLHYQDEELDRIAGHLPGGMGQPADVADVVTWLCSPGARHVNGQAIVVDGGAILS